MERTFLFAEKLWVYAGPAAWYFVTLSKELSEQIDFYYAHLKAGWGSLPVEVHIGSSVWQTSIFPDSKTDSYMLPVKKTIRVQEKLGVGGMVNGVLTVRE